MTDGNKRSFSLIDSIIGKQDALQKSIAVVAQEKRPRIDPGRPTFQSLYELFNDLKKNAHLHLKDFTTLEVEARIGMIVATHRRWKSTFESDNVLMADDNLKKSFHLNFRSGIDEVMFDKLKKILSSEGFKPELLPPKRQRSNFNHERWDVDSAGVVKRSIENKIKLLRCDLALLSHHYDIRIDAASETPQTTPNTSFNPDIWHLERLKRRISYTPPRQQGGVTAAAYWRIDLTEVESVTNGSSEVIPHIDDTPSTSDIADIADTDGLRFVVGI
eukprot:gene3679-7320_t